MVTRRRVAVILQSIPIWNHDAWTPGIHIVSYASYTANLVQNPREPRSCLETLEQKRQKWGRLREASEALALSPE